MHLYLLQHAHAEPKSVDPDRPLTPEGRADLDRLSERLAAAGVSVERVVHSGKTRAMQSAARMARRLLAHGEMDTSGLLEPDADPGAFIAWLGDLNEDILVVGHLPFVARLADRLLGVEGAASRVDFAPGCLLCLRRTGDGWQLSWMLRPELLTD